MSKRAAEGTESGPFTQSHVSSIKHQITTIEQQKTQAHSLHLRLSEVWVHKPHTHTHKHTQSVGSTPSLWLRRSCSVFVISVSMCELAITLCLFVLNVRTLYMYSLVLMWECVHVGRDVDQSFLTQLLNNTLLCTGSLYPLHTLRAQALFILSYWDFARVCVCVCVCASI